RSPRPLCSITIGIRPRPLGSSMKWGLVVRVNRSAGRLFRPRAVEKGRWDFDYRSSSAGWQSAHQLLERDRLVGHFRARDNPVDDILLERHRFEIPQPLGL